MNENSIFAISAAGMALERARVEVAALNLANAHAAQAPGQPAYNALRVVASGSAAPAFAALMEPGFRVEPAGTAPRKVHEPGHPLADSRGFVSYPGVDTATEMVTMMDGTRAYEANLAAISTSRTLALKALDIGGST